MRRTLEGREKIFGAEHPEAFPAAHNLENILADLGKLNPAESMLQRAIQEMEEMLVKEHVDTLRSVL